MERQIFWNLCGFSEKEKIDSVLVEGGADINDSVIQAGTVNKVYALSHRKFRRKTGRSPVEGEGVNKISDALLLNGPEITRFGEDLLLEYKVR